MEKLLPIWPFLGLPFVPKDYTSIQNIIRLSVKEILHQPYTELLFDEISKKMFSELNNINDQKTFYGDSFQIWIQSDFVTMLQTVEQEPWRNFWKVLLSRIGRYKEGRPTLLLSQKKEEFFALLETFIKQDAFNYEQIYEIDDLPWVEWDKEIYEDYYSFSI